MTILFYKTNRISIDLLNQCTVHHLAQLYVSTAKNNLGEDEMLSLYN